MVQGRPRYDQKIVDYLVKEKFDYFDMNEIHLQDFKKNNPGLSLEEYMKRYCVVINGRINHYSAVGNHFFAYAIKNKIVEWLVPKPVNYQ
jgi:hypothetical protein